MHSALVAGRRDTDLAIAGLSRRTRPTTGGWTSGRSRRISATSKIGCVAKEKMHPPGMQISNRFLALSGEDEPNLCSVEKQWTSGRITVDSGAAESVWLAEDLMPEVQTKPSVRSQTGVAHIASNGNRMPNLGEKKVHFKTKDGLNPSITFQVTKVKPLADVSKITKKGNWVCFGPSGACIENVATSKRTDLEFHNGTYSLDVKYFREPGFTRLDRR